MCSTGVPVFWNLLGSSKKCAARSRSPRSSAASQRRMTRVDAALAGPVARSGTFGGSCKSDGIVCVWAPLPGVVSVRSTGSRSFAPPPQAATPAVANTDSRIVTARRPPDMEPSSHAPEGPRKGRCAPLRRGAPPLGPMSSPPVLRHGKGRGPTVMLMPSDTRLWHPFADMHAVRGAEIVITRGDGAYVWDADSRRYLDGTASLWN